ncbi:MAG: bifunctional glutamate N-acetyltransferase/amino-acid acetyltransferase ArgJ [Pikeienuella sp.]
MGKSDSKKPGSKKNDADKADKFERKRQRLAAKVANIREKLIKAEAKIADHLGLTADDKPGQSPFAQPFPDLPAVKGVRVAAAEAGVRYEGRKDVMLAEIAEGSAIAGVFTKSATRSAPVDWCREQLAGLRKAMPKGPMAIVVNSGNANAFTGKGGMVGVERTAAAAAKAVGGEPSGVFIASTGVIGEALPAAKITGKLKSIAKTLDDGTMRDGAEAIMTTDTFPKGAGRTITLDGIDYAIAGFAKGSGMIAPDMATMLGFIFTDAPVSRAYLQSVLSRATKISFNAATVDGDTSTSDTVIVAATGAAGGKRLSSRKDPRADAFEAALTEVLQDLAQQIVKDGEGASKFVTIRVTGAKSDTSAAIIARAIANSPLVKTAIAGEDPNWGRVVMAVGKSGQPANRDTLSIRFGDILVADKGWVAKSYAEEAGADYMKNAEIEITTDLGVGEGSAEVWTCDLSHQYIAINADYRS